MKTEIDAQSGDVTSGQALITACYKDVQFCTEMTRTVSGDFTPRNLGPWRAGRTRFVPKIAIVSAALRF